MSNIFTKISKQLYPTGRVWRIKPGGIFYKLHEGLAESEQAVYDKTSILSTAILPDNDNFTEKDATNWERALGLVYQPYLLLSERKTIIRRKMRHPGDIPARQHYLYLEGQLQAAGFSVYVHENRFGSPPIVADPIPALYGNINYGELNYGEIGFDYSLLMNYVDEDKDKNTIVGGYQQLRATFFIGGTIYPNRANVSAVRKKEFREMILKLKPAHTAGFLLIDYI